MIRCQKYINYIYLPTQYNAKKILQKKKNKQKQNNIKRLNTLNYKMYGNTTYKNFTKKKKEFGHNK